MASGAAAQPGSVGWVCVAGRRGRGGGQRPLRAELRARAVQAECSPQTPVLRDAWGAPGAPGCSAKGEVGGVTWWWRWRCACVRVRACGDREGEMQVSLPLGASVSSSVQRGDKNSPYLLGVGEDSVGGSTAAPGGSHASLMFYY